MYFNYNSIDYHLSSDNCLPYKKELKFHCTEFIFSAILNCKKQLTYKNSINWIRLYFINIETLSSNIEHGWFESGTIWNN